jgi:hypothetical protein
MSTEYIIKKLRALSPFLQAKVGKFIESLEKGEKAQEKKRFSFDWEGGLENLRSRYTSVELQKEIVRVWGGH